ncbi:MAG: sigma-70 family RNA polymerase sigma factor [Paludisphaera borealis]|uniref:sigma-70 family RNA polymerase sigma factor n=1 Tax=Paludisphaera borealis TaxID=1387353 RepID=UPI002842BBD9|nr:sigma-70 family RNA polymerase sigma factor [Paludisphaera borealis]MDR3620991.1 sigma-70 family RNA polymerase sigma factor [Paludisphaera borealis]
MAHAPLSHSQLLFHRLFNEGAAMSLSDAQLAERFVATRDHDAFAALVARHGPMVMAVCRGSLGPSGDADDAFQATFLVLLNRLGTFPVGGSLGGWLHRVARRMARQARRSRTRRRSREAAAPPRTGASAEHDPERSEIVDVIRKEVDLLPERYRAPIVLCDLEGLSRDDAAELLGCPPGTVGGRLARARKRLRERLERRGVEPSLVPLAHSADAWRTSVDAAVRSAAALAAGSSPTPVVLTLATQSAGLAASVPAKATAALMIAACLAGGIFAAGRTTESPLPPPPPPSKQVNEPPKTPVERPEFEDPALAGRYVGKVVDADDRPLPGARLFIVRYDPNPEEIGPARVQTDAEGRFEFDAPDMRFIAYDGLPFRRQGLLVATADGYAPDWVVTWGRKRSTFRTHWDPIMGADLKLKLTRGDVPIHGTILDHEGRPVAGARVRASLLSIPGDHDLDKHLKEFTESMGLAGACHVHSLYRPGLLPGVRAEAATDADGRFQISGLGRDRLADLTLTPPGAADVHLRVMTREAPDVFVGRDLKGNPIQSILGAGFTHRLAPDDRITITGVVRDRDTHEPIPGVWVGRNHWTLLQSQEGSQHVVTDAEGRFTITGVNPQSIEPPPPAPANDFEAMKAMMVRPVPLDLVAVPQPGQPYLRAHVLVEKASGVVIECARGVPYRLTVVDGDGKPVDGRVEAHAVKPNPYFDQTRTSNDTDGAPVSRALKTAPGVYEGVVILGPGAVVMETPDDHGYRPPLLDPKAFFAPGKTDWTDRELSDAYGSRSLIMLEDNREAQECYAAIVLVNPPLGSKPLELSATVARGRPRRVTLVDTEGRPVVGASPEGLTEHPGDYEPPLRASTFPLTRLHPGRVRRMTFVKEDRKLVGSLLARGDGDAPYTVVMQPWATVTGRFVDLLAKPPEEKGTPFLDMDARSRIADHDDPEKGEFPQTWPDREGRFRVERLVPGLRYRAAVYRNGVRVGIVGRTLVIESAFKDLVLKPGEVRDLGDIRVTD